MNSRNGTSKRFVDSTSGTRSLLAHALTVRGVRLARMREHKQALATLERAAAIATQAGDLERAGLAAITLVEQLGHRLSNRQLCSAIDRAGRCLENSDDLSAIRRLEKITRQALFWTNAYAGRPDWSTFNLKEVQLRNECYYVEHALADANGSVTKAAELLGLASHQSLLYMLNGRLRNLVNRPPTKARKRKPQKDTNSTD